MIFGYDNKADAATLTVGSELSTLPGANTQNALLSKKWGTAAGVKTSSLIWDMGSSVSCSAFAALGTNFTSAATHRLRASDVDPTVTATLLYDSGSVSAGVKTGYGAVYLTFAAVAARYWRWDPADAAVSDNLQVGRVFLGPSWTPTIDMQLGVSYATLDDSDEAQTYGLQLHFDEKTQRRLISFMLDFLTESEIFDNAFAMARANGRVRDVLVIPNPTGSYVSEQSVWGTLQASEPIVNERLSIYRQKFTVKERL